jgi:glutamine---fructose-6-phosphate transaminase (isomerizing)
VNGELMTAELAEQVQVLGRLVDRFAADTAAIAAITPRPLAGIALLGRGSSDNAATLGRYLVELSSGRPAGLSAASLLTRYGADTDYRGYLLVAYSQSGRTPEIVTAAQLARERGARVLAVTNDIDSPLAAAADAVLALGTGPERAVPATKTVTAQLLASVAVACAVARPGHEPVAFDALAALPNAVATVLADDNPARELAARWAGQRRLLVVARGLGYAAAQETALKIRETAGVFAQGMSSADLLHGPIASVDPALPVLLLDAGGPGGADVAELADRLISMGIDVAWCAARPDAALPLTAGLPEALATIVATVRGQQLALEWSRAIGVDPDAPTGLSKITDTR